MRYSFFVGSTDFHNAHISGAAFDAIPRDLVINAVLHKESVWGVWEGATEETLIIPINLRDDATAQRIAYAIARATGNDAVLVSRESTYNDGIRGFNSTREYSADVLTKDYGNRTLFNSPEDWAERHTGVQPGYTYVRNVRGEGTHVVFLVTKDAEILSL